MKEITILAFDDPNFPSPLRRIINSPQKIYIRGTLLPEDRIAVAIVGTRNPTPYGQDVAARLAYDFAQAGVTVVSGLALGIDGIAHCAALGAGGRTLAILAGGFDSIYPRQHYALGYAITQRGALISEHEPSAPWRKNDFLTRNRLISGLSLATIVVEGAPRSGTMSTARHAMQQGRPVFAVPGSIYSPMSAGPNQLLTQGARPALSAGEIIKALELRLA